jgi:hypothetical protein
MVGRYILFLALSVACTPLVAGDLEVLFSNKSGEISYIRDGSFINLDDSEISVGVFMNEDNNTIPYAGLLSEVLKDKVRLAKSPLKFYLGGRLYTAFLNTPEDDVFGLAFSASLRYTIPFERIPLHLATSIHFAPEVLTSGTNTNIFDWHVVRAEIDLTEHTTGFVGFRKFEIDRPEGVGSDRDLDEKVHLGLRFRF